MPKATLEFNLPEERVEFKLASSALEYSSCLWDIKNILRQHYKYGHKFKDADEAVEKIYDEVLTIISEHGITDEI